MIIIKGGVAAPDGFRASSATCGIKKNGRPDLALVVSDKTAQVAGVYTQNSIRGNSLKLTVEHAGAGYARAVIVNSGNANACNGDSGYANAHTVCDYVARSLRCQKNEVLFNSTGVIGYPLNMNKLLPGIDKAVAGLSKEGGTQAAEAIMTTDTYAKEIAVEFELHGKNTRIGGMAKGSGMIHPNMATMISVITTDANISGPLLQSSLKKVCDKTFNRTSVDGDTSVCDMVVMLANGGEEKIRIEQNQAEYQKFMSALDHVCTYLARNIASDGEGATKLLDIHCVNAKTPQDAYMVVNAVAKSPLVKTNFFGMDANWGRIITAAGYSGAYLEESKIDIFIGDMQFCKNGSAVAFSEEAALKILKEKEIKITIDLKLGSYSDRIWTCDLSCDYVKINGSYRT
jgi:glutamate N-acetyltransferase / amino-acid N-acetyltransferase